MMQRPCHSCGFVSDRPTRFCRQCGAQLSLENEATSATTRQYAPQQPANPYDAPYQSQLAQARSAPDNRFDNPAPETSRLYQTPIGQNYSNYPANYQQPVAKKSGALKWVVITLLCLLIVSIGIGAMVISAIRANQAAAEQAGRAAEESGAPPPLPSAPPPPRAIESGLDQYKYPNAKVINSFRVLDNEAVTMTTTDSVSDVREYYRKRFGDPWLEDEDSATVMFQIPGSPATVITVKEDEEDSDNTQIVVVRSNYQLPKMN
jgi:hypothetical protein